MQEPKNKGRQQQRWMDAFKSYCNETLISAYQDRSWITTGVKAIRANLNY